MTGPRLAISVGEPAGIGPDIVIKAARELSRFNTVLLADPSVLHERAEMLELDFPADSYLSGNRAPGLSIAPTRLVHSCRAGRADARNAPAVLAALERGVKGCLSGEFDALVTGPVNKAVMRKAGLDFMGHTEYLARLSGAPMPVMLLACETDPGRAPLRVALATTHIPLSAVPGAVTRERLAAVLEVLVQGLKRDFGIGEPRVAVLGLNPHAGEDGELGSEDRDVVARAIAEFGDPGVTGPWPADTAFTRDNLAGQDALLAMYHDQGLPVVKHAGFGATVNVTLGLPFVRTSVDHGTAFDLAGTGKADEGSLVQAVAAAARMVRYRSDHPEQ
ncbi:MAG: 4-hydroxythreonine-4-phosphate dehydrogenase PdxA [Gammaproteobacteria bacterium]|nr:4-hydroxythreonine-4-phosphate dehydrogenase PdxA [Gammaproteobacteria bacterium]